MRTQAYVVHRQWRKLLYILHHKEFLLLNIEDADRLPAASDEVYGEISWFHPVVTLGTTTYFPSSSEMAL